MLFKIHILQPQLPQLQLMKKMLLFVLPVSIMILFVACQKELHDPTVTGAGGTGGTGGADITGTWNFVSNYASTQSTVQFSYLGSSFKTVTVSDYTSTNNTGIIVITSNSMAGTGLSYNVSDTAIAFSYIDNVLIDTIQQRFSLSVPLYSSVYPYKRITQDSIYFTGPGIDPSAAGGTRIALSGNILKMTTAIVKDTTFDGGGYLVSRHSTATAITTLQKQ
jgi:hypothetical protein